MYGGLASNASDWYGVLFVSPTGAPITPAVAFSQGRDQYRVEFYSSCSVAPCFGTSCLNGVQPGQRILLRVVPTHHDACDAYALDVSQ